MGTISGSTMKTGQQTMGILFFVDTGRVEARHLTFLPP
jgi:hypothetical protein